MLDKSLSKEDLHDLELMKKIRQIIFYEKNVDIKITAGRDGTIKVVKQKNSNIK